MSDYGLRIKNDNGNIQIDSKYSNYLLVDEGSNVAISNSSGSRFTSVSFSEPLSVCPIVAFRPSTDEYSFVSAITKSGSNFTGFVAGTSYNNSTTIDYRAYIPMKEESFGADRGLRVRNSSGDVVFSSEKEYFTIKKVVLANDLTAEVEHVGIENPFYINQSTGFYVQIAIVSGQKGAYRIRGALKKVSSTKVAVGSTWVYSHLVNWAEETGGYTIVPRGDLLIVK